MRSLLVHWMRGLALLGLIGCQHAWREQAPLAQTNITLRAPAFERQPLENGVSLYVHTDQMLPLVSLRLTLRPGESTLTDPTEAGALLLLHTHLLRGAEMERLRQELPGQLTRVRDVDGLSIELQVLPAQVPQALQRLSQIVQTPNLTESAVREAQVTLLRERFEQTETPHAQADRVLLQSLFPGSHDFAWRQVNRQQIGTLSNLALPHVQAAYDRYIGPQNTGVVVYGPVPSPLAFSLVQRWFGDWNKPTVPLGKYPPVAARRSTIYIVPVPGAQIAQVAIATSVPGVDQSIAAEVALRLLAARMNHALSHAAEPSPMLIATRTSRAHGQILAFMNGFVLRESVGAYVDSLQQELRKSLPPENRESEPMIERAAPGTYQINPLAIQRAMLARTLYWKFMGQFESLSSRSELIADHFSQDLPDTFVQEQMRTLRHLTLHQSQKLLLTAFAPEKLHMVLTGDPERLQAQLASRNLEPVQVLPLSD